MSEIIMEAVDVEFAYPDGTKALKGLNMSIQKGKKIAVLGSNGAGKSTLFLHFNGIYKPTLGCIKYMGQELSYSHSSLMYLRKKVGIVFQDPDNQLFSASVIQEISFGPLNLGLSDNEVMARVTQAMEETEIIEIKNKPTHMLSFGQKKRVSIADILVMEPELIIFDEPTAWLDPRHAAEFMILLDKLSQEGKTIIISTHDVDLAYSWSDYIFVLHDGQVVGEGDPGEIFQQEELLKKTDLSQPWVVEMHFELVKKGWLPPKSIIAKNRKELYDYIPWNK